MALAQGLNGFRAETPENLILDAGVMYRDINETLLAGSGSTAAATALAAGTKLGATRDGAEFNPNKVIRHVEADGLRYKVAGLERSEGGDPQIQVTLLEMTLQNLTMMLAPVDVVPHAQFNEIRGSLDLTMEHYLANVALAATISGTDVPVIIVVRHALCLANPTMSTKDKNEMAVQVVFTGHALAEDIYASPYSIWYPIGANLS